MTKEDKKYYFGMGIFFLIVMIAVGLFATFLVRWIVSYETYEDVDWEWDYERNRYNIYIEELGCFHIRTDEAVMIFLPDDLILNAAIVKKEETILGQFVNYKLEKFYINVGWRGE